jgi:hypothetical protein
MDCGDLLIECVIEYHIHYTPKYVAGVISFIIFNRSLLMAKSNLGNVLCSVAIRMKGVPLVLSLQLKRERQRFFTFLSHFTSRHKPR